VNNEAIDYLMKQKKKKKRKKEEKNQDQSYK